MCPASGDEVIKVHNEGFTLVEFMVVIAILDILAQNSPVFYGVYRKS